METLAENDLVRCDRHNLFPFLSFPTLEDHSRTTAPHHNALHTLPADTCLGDDVQGLLRAVIENPGLLEIERQSLLERCTLDRRRRRSAALRLRAADVSCSTAGTAVSKRPSSSGR